MRFPSLLRSVLGASLLVASAAPAAGDAEETQRPALRAASLAQDGLPPLQLKHRFKQPRPTPPPKMPTP